MTTGAIGLTIAIFLGRRRIWLGALAALALIAGAQPASAGSSLAAHADVLDEIAFAVGGVESSHGADPSMWRPDLDGPQGPMQVSAAAASDVGGGDRFDTKQNRLLGRAYLARLYRHFANWPDAIAAYNWGPGKMDTWIGAGRPVAKFPISVSFYRLRVLYGPVAASGIGAVRFARRRPPRRSLADMRHPSAESRAVERLYTVLIGAGGPNAR